MIMVNDETVTNNSENDDMETIVNEDSINLEENNIN